MKALTAELPYPGLEGIQESSESICIIAPAYAGRGSEMTATLQYVYQSIIFSGLKMQEISDTLLSIAIAEMEHLELLGKMILKMGAKPIYSERPPVPSRFYTTSYVGYSVQPQKMIADDIRGETEAIEGYTCMAEKLKDEQAAAIISRIILDEKVHLAQLKKIYKELVEGCTQD